MILVIFYRVCSSKSPHIITTGSIGSMYTHMIEIVICQMCVVFGVPSTCTNDEVDLLDGAAAEAFF